MKVLTDLEIIEGIKQGKVESFRTLQNRFSPIILGYVVNRGGTIDEGKTIIQDTFLVLWEKITKGKFIYKANGLLKSYVMNIAVNLWLKELKRKKQGKIKYVEKSELAYFADKMIIPKWYDKTEENLALIHRAIQQLDPSCQQLIRYYYQHEIKLKDLSTDLDIQYDSLKMKIYRCREKIKELIFFKNMN